jgi:NitT/TauT family transport system ATP-binding protein
MHTLASGGAADSGGPDPMLSVRGVRKVYRQRDRPDVVAVGDVTFEARAHEILTIVGPSGCGKTTLLTCLAGLALPTEGEIRFRGSPIRRPPEGVSVVFQDYSRSLFPWLTVEKNLVIGLRHGLGLTKQESVERIGQALSSVGLSGNRDFYPWQLSGGMQQRVAIARAIAMSPDLLLMDEPFASVDAQTRMELEDLVLSVRDEFGMGVVFITHDIDEAVYMADRLLVLSGRPSTVLRSLDVPLGSSRDQVDTKMLPEFVSLRSEVLDMIRHAGQEQRRLSTDATA